MRYMGGKSRIAKQIVSILENHRKKNQVFAEPFVGAANIISKMSGQRIAFDAHKELIAMYNAIKNGWIPPTQVSEDEYNDIKHSYYNNYEKYPDYLYGFVGFACSFGGGFFNVYARGFSDKGIQRNYCNESKEGVLLKMKTLMQTKFINASYDKLHFNDCLIYCDPPYQNTKGYSVGEFDSQKFAQIMREWSKNNTVFISEYTAPAEDFKCIAEFEVNQTISSQSNSTKIIEKLFVHESTILKPNIFQSTKLRY